MLCASCGDNAPLPGQDICQGCQDDSDRDTAEAWTEREADRLRDALRTAEA